MNAEFKQTFIPVLTVSNRSSRKLSSYLARAKIYPIDRIVGSKDYGKKRCEVCANVYQTDTFSSTVTGETFKINHKLNCDDKCLIYLFTRKWCGKRYVGKPLGSLGLGGTTTKCNDRKYTWNEDCFQEHQFRHFHSGKHTGFLENVLKTLIDEADGQNPEKRR